jgi:8-oxo-dGTP pyrophosphatase MutT (NUDIX family)
MTIARQLRAALDSTFSPSITGDEIYWVERETPAAVLLAITDRVEPGLILTQRPVHMRNHAGQVAFPGGQIDTTDADHFAAALREAKEEISLDPAFVQILGTSDTYRTGSGFTIKPVLGMVPPDLPFHANADEVADIFEVPLAHVLDPANHLRLRGERDGRWRHFYEINWQDRRIWGATAGIIVNLAMRFALVAA